MTEQEITQARADIAQLDIEQLRCGVMLQLLKIEALTKERDEYAKASDSMAMQHKMERDALALGIDQWRVEFHELRLEHDALMSAADSHKVVRDTLTARLNVLEAAAKLALEALVAESRTTESNVTLVRILTAITSLRQAGVQ